MKFLLLLFLTSLQATLVPEKVVICGVARNVEAAIPNTIQSINELGSHFAGYRVIIYENNSRDQTKKLFREWAEKDPHVTFFSEMLSPKQLRSRAAMGRINRTEGIAKARNIILDLVLSKSFNDYKYVIWADLDFLEPWDVKHIVDTIVHPEQEWDAVFAYGAYDRFALRSPEFPIGFELIGDPWWKHLDVYDQFTVDKEQWKKVYSAFGGFGIYQREALKGCRYSGVVTKDLDTMMVQWLKKAREEKRPLLNLYEELLAKEPSIELKGKTLPIKKADSPNLGVRLADGQITWFSYTPGMTLPWTCEHVPLHASMALRGHDRLFINPKIRSNTIYQK